MWYLLWEIYNHFWRHQPNTQRYDSMGRCTAVYICIRSTPTQQYFVRCKMNWMRFFFAQKTKTHSRQHESTPIDYNSLELVLWFVILHIHVCSIILNDFTVILIEFSSIYNIFGIEKICVVLCVVVCVCARIWRMATRLHNRIAIAFINLFSFNWIRCN